MPRRRRFKQILTLKERLEQEATRLLAQTAALPPCPERERLLRKAGQLESASRIEEWLSSPRLAPPE
ncbi:hypothetical protein CT676_41825 [Bradyrhizobium sp. MOS001]|nr:hypothetical protein [Bradyrhizobium sp. MOS001]TFW52979.1 hypothetical protein CT676_41825 [Bradyrhizobium sp. MOS001]